MRCVEGCDLVSWVDSDLYLMLIVFSAAFWIGFSSTFEVCLHAAASAWALWVGHAVCGAAMQEQQDYALLDEDTASTVVILGSCLPSLMGQPLLAAPC